MSESLENGPVDRVISNKDVEAAGAQNHLQKPSKIEPQIEVVRVNSAELYG